MNGDMIVDEPRILPKRFQVLQVLDVDKDDDPVDQIVEKVLIQEKVSPIDLSHELFAERNACFFLCPFAFIEGDGRFHLKVAFIHGSFFITHNLNYQN